MRRGEVVVRRARRREGRAMVERMWWVVRLMRGGFMVGDEVGDAHGGMFQVRTMERKVT